MKAQLRTSGSLALLLLGHPVAQSEFLTAIDARQAGGSISCVEDVVGASHSWSFDGKHISFMTRQGQTVIVTNTEGTLRERSRTSLGGVAVWSHRGGRLLILRPDHSDDNRAATATLYIWFTGSGDPPVPLADNLSANLRPSWSPDDELILAQAVTGALVVIEPWTGNRRLAYAPAHESVDVLNGLPVWIDMRRIAVQIGVGQLYAVDVDRASASLLLDGPAILELGSNGMGPLWAIQIGDGIVNRIGSIDDHSFITLLSGRFTRFDGPNSRQQIVVASHDRGELKLIDSVSGLIAPLPGDTGNSEPIWSPDGLQIAFNRSDDRIDGQSLCVMHVG